MKNITREEIKKTIEEVLHDNSFISEEQEVRERHSYENDYGMDSLDLVGLVMGIEKVYDISIPDDAAERMDTVARTIDYLHIELNR